MVTLLVVNYFWKFTVTGDEYGDEVTWFGIDISAPFIYMTHHVAHAVYGFVALFRDTVHLLPGHRIQFDSGNSITVVWGCSGLKQAFIFMCLILTVRPIKFQISNLKFQIAKLWFIPLGWVCCYLFNVLRIGLIALLIEHHPSWFPFLHDGLFKYLFYAMLFGLWAIFVAKIRPDSSAH